MALKDFKSYQLAIQFYREASALKLPSHLRDQLSRASSSIVLNLAEGSGKPTQKDRRKFYYTALGSQRECAAVLELATATAEVRELCDRVGAHVYKLAKSERC